jgi:hypothetical protein
MSRLDRKTFENELERLQRELVIHADDKRRARLNCISHLLSLIPYKDLTPPPFALPTRRDDIAYVRPPLTDQTFVPEPY